MDKTTKKNTTNHKWKHAFEYFPQILYLCERNKCNPVKRSNFIHPPHTSPFSISPEISSMSPEYYSIVIVEDTQIASDALTKSLQRHPNYKIAAIAPTLAEARKAISEKRPDLLFLDVELPDGKGFELIENMRPYITWNMKTVFYTAFDKYMINAIHAAAFDYLLKPFTDEELDEILQKFSSHIHDLMNFTTTVGPLQAEKNFTIQLSTNDIRILKLSEIGYFKLNGTRRCWEVYLFNGVSLPLRTTIKTEQILNSSDNFMQVHQSFIVNMSYLAMIHNKSCVMYPPFNAIEIPLSSRYKKSLQERFLQL